MYCFLFLDEGYTSSWRQLASEYDLQERRLRINRFALRLRKVYTGFIKGILRGVRYAKSLRVLFLHRRSPSWTTLVLYSRAVFIFNEPTNSPLERPNTPFSLCRLGERWNSGQIWWLATPLPYNFTLLQFNVKVPTRGVAFKCWPFLRLLSLRGNVSLVQQSDRAYQKTKTAEYLWLEYCFLCDLFLRLVGLTRAINQTVHPPHHHRLPWSPQMENPGLITGFLTTFQPYKWSQCHMMYVL